LRHHQVGRAVDLERGVQPAGGNGGFALGQKRHDRAHVQPFQQVVLHIQQIAIA
jgi:hypothetical protein